MKRSFRARISLAGISLLMLFVFLNIIFTLFCMTPFSEWVAANRMERLAYLIKSELKLSETELNEYIESLNEDYNTTVTIVDSSKKIIATTSYSVEKRQSLGRISTFLFDENFENLEKGKPVRYYKDWDSEPNQEESDKSYKKESSDSIRIFVLRKIDDDRYVILSRSFQSFSNATSIAILFNILSGCIILVIGILIILKFSDIMVKPVKEITTVAEHVANLEFDMEAPENDKDEIGQLGISINKMSKSLESDLIQLRTDIETRKKLVRNLSHEIKSPVAVIMGYADRLKTVVDNNPEKAVKYSEIISNESSRIDILVREMLDFSKIEQNISEISLETFKAEKLLCKIENRVREENLESRITLNVSCDDSDINADMMLLESALYNLVNNAICHSTIDNPAINVTGYKEEALYKFKVHNTGSHIPEDELPFIWDAFYKVDKARKRGKSIGGVGLSIVKEIVDAHNGMYEAGNDEDGVYFVIGIPACNE